MYIGNAYLQAVIMALVSKIIEQWGILRERIVQDVINLTRAIENTLKLGNVDTDALKTISDKCKNHQMVSDASLTKAFENLTQIRVLIEKNVTNEICKDTQLVKPTYR